jgi:hypothetical protein
MIFSKHCSSIIFHENFSMFFLRLKNPSSNSSGNIWTGWQTKGDIS